MSEQFKELVSIITEQKKVMGEMRADWQNCASYKKDIDNLATEYKQLKDAVATLQGKAAMTPSGKNAPSEEVKAFAEYARKGVNNTIVGPQGGFLVPKPIHNQIMLLATEDNFIRQNATILTTNAGSLDIPYEDDSDTVDFIGELETKPQSEAPFKNVHINIHDLNREVPVTKQLIEDSAFDVEGFIISHIAKKVANAEENTFLNGESPKQPEGILRANLPNVSAGDEIKVDDLVDMRMQDGVSKSSVLNKSKYLMNPATFQYLTKMKDANDRPFNLPIGDKFVPALHGYPIGVSHAMPVMGNGNKSVVFGDFSGYVILDRAAGIEIQRNPYRVGGQVIFEFWHRVGGAVGDASKLVTLSQGGATAPANAAAPHQVMRSMRK